MAIFHFPPAQTTGATQPYGKSRNLPPDTTAVTVNDPPFNPRRLAVLALVVAITQPDPFIYQPQGGRQPYAGTNFVRTELAQEVDEPPYPGVTRMVSQVALTALIAQPDPWSYTFNGDQQPYAGRLNDEAPGLSIEFVPFGQSFLQARSAVVSQQQPDAWVYFFDGSTQPYGPRRQSPGIPGLDRDQPPVSKLGGPYALNAEIIALNQPDPWSFVYMGPARGLQPYAQRLLHPSVMDVAVNTPPFDRRRLALVHSITAQSIPDPWTYTFTANNDNSGQPYATFKGNRFEAPTLTNEPPYGQRRLQQYAGLIALNQPSVWPYNFEGGSQPYAPTPLSPTFEGIPIPPPGSGKRPRTTPFIPEPPRDVKPNKPFQPIWDKTRGQIAVAQPAAAPAPPPPPLPPPSIFAQPEEPDPTKMGLPTFNETVPPNHVGLTHRMQEAQDVSDAIAVLQALGLFKSQG